MSNGTMKAITQNVFGDPTVMTIGDTTKPTPAGKEVVVRVAAAGVNPVDAKVRRGGAPGTPVPNAPRILGWDGAGTVEEIGPEATLFEKGDEVYFAGALNRQGSYAQFISIDERIVARKPTTMDFAQSAAIPLTALTAWEAIVENMGIPTNGSASGCLLVVGGAGGVGSIASEIATKVCGMRLISTASRPESTERCRELGAEHVLDHRRPLAPQLSELGIGGVDYILTTATLENFGDLVECLNPLGHICTIAGGDGAKCADLTLLKTKRATFSYEFMFTRSMLDSEPEIQGRILTTVAGLLDKGVLSPSVARVFDWTEVAEAHRQIETEHTLGKLVLKISD